MRKKILLIAIATFALAIILECWVLYNMPGNYETFTFYASTKNIEKDQVIRSDDIKKVEIRIKKGDIGQMAASINPIGKVALRSISKNRFIVEMDYSENQQQGQTHTMVIVLNIDQAHLGNFINGEKIDVIIEKDQRTEIVENLTFVNISLLDRGNMDESKRYVTLCGTSDKLVKIEEAISKGTLRLIKKQ